MSNVKAPLSWQGQKVVERTVQAYQGLIKQSGDLAGAIAASAVEVGLSAVDATQKASPAP
jgi:hypothetical protein